MMKMRPFFQTLQNFPHKVYKHLSTRPLPISNPLWEQAKAEAIAWEPVRTLEEEDESWLNSKVQVCILSTPPSMSHISDMDTIAEMPALNVKKVMSHILDAPDTFAAIANELLTPGVKDKTLIPRIPTAELHAPKHITNSLRHVNTTDPFLPSTRMTPNYEFAIVPRRTAPLPLNEHKLSVEQLINAAIVTFHLEHHRLPHKITIAAIRYLRYRISIDTYDPNIFYYDDMPIPITSAPVGDFGIDEVWLD